MDHELHSLIIHDLLQTRKPCHDKVFWFVINHELKETLSGVIYITPGGMILAARQ